jgi:hypothetical protein
VDSLLSCCKQEISLLTNVIVFQAITEAFKMAADPDLEWTATILDVKPQVILHDRLMTDAALGTAPIKTEHSYSLTSDGDSIPDSPLSLDNKMDGKDTFYTTENWTALKYTGSSFYATAGSGGRVGRSFRQVRPTHSAQVRFTSALSRKHAV